MNWTKLIIPIIVLALIVAAYLYGLNTAPQKLSPFEKKEWKYKRSIDSLKSLYRKQVLRDSTQYALIQELLKEKKELQKKTLIANEKYNAIKYSPLASDSARYRLLSGLYKVSIGPPVGN